MADDKTADPAETPTSIFRQLHDEFPESDFHLLAKAHGLEVATAEFVHEHVKRDGNPGHQIRIVLPEKAAD